MCTGTIFLIVGLDNYDTQNTKFCKTKGKAEDIKNLEHQFRMHFIKEVNINILSSQLQNFRKKCLFPLDAVVVSCPNSNKKS